MAALGDRPLLLLCCVLDALQREQRVDGGDRTQTAGLRRAMRGFLLVDAEAAGGGASRGARLGGERGAARSIDAHRIPHSGRVPVPPCVTACPRMVNRG